MAFGPCSVRMAREFFGDEIVHFVPGDAFQLAIAPDHGVLQTLRVVVERKSVTPFQAGVAFVDLRVPRGLDAEDGVVFDAHLEVAAHAAVGTHGAHFILSHEGFGLINIGNGRSRASLRTGATGHAIGLEETLVEPFDDLAVEAAPRHAQHQLALHLVAGADAAEAHDALRQVGGHVRVAQVFFAGRSGFCPPG